MDDFTRNTVASFLGSMKSSVEIAATLASHNRDDSTVTKVDMVAGLIYRLMVPMKDDEVVAYAASGSDLLAEIEMDEGDASDEDCFEATAADGCSSVDDDALLDISRYPCNCEVCSAMRVAILNFPTYEATDGYTQIMLNAIHKTCAEHGVVIGSK